MAKCDVYGRLITHIYSHLPPFLYMLNSTNIQKTFHETFLIWYRVNCYGSELRTPREIYGSAEGGRAMQKKLSVSGEFLPPLSNMLWLNVRTFGQIRAEFLNSHYTEVGWTVREISTVWYYLWIKYKCEWWRCFSGWSSSYCFFVFSLLHIHCSPCVSISFHDIIFFLLSQRVLMYTACISHWSHLYDECGVCVYAHAMPIKSVETEDGGHSLTLRRHRNNFDHRMRKWRRSQH